jgi:PAS domain S-box-containing protein
MLGAAKGEGEVADPGQCVSNNGTAGRWGGRKGEVSLLEEVFRDVKEGIGVVDENEKIVLCNPAYARIFDEEPERLLGERLSDFLDEDSFNKVIEQTRARRSGRAGTYELSIVTRRGNRKEIRISALPRFDAYGSYRGALGTILDITERRQAERRLRRYSERLEEMVDERTRELREAQEDLIRKERLATLGQLAGGVGHELRNSLGAVKNSAYFLKMALEGSDPDIMKAIDILDREVTASDRIISSLLDFARLRAPTFKEVNVNDLLVEEMDRLSISKDIKVVTRLKRSMPAVQADPDQLGQVFGNIIVNAVQAMPSGGRLGVSTGVCGSGWISVSISDTGVGIAEEDLGKLFIPLFTTKVNGIGLGLAITHRLVERHGGKIEVKSEVGKGSTFTVRLPQHGRVEDRQPEGDHSG